MKASFGFKNTGIKLTGDDTPIQADSPTPVNLPFESPPEEIAAMQPQVTWHMQERPLRIALTSEIWRDWLAKKREHEEMFELTGVELYPDLVEVIGIINYLRDYMVIENGTVYVYLEKIYPEHEPIIKKYGGIIETKPTV
jgi:hypothetical protein